MSTEITKTKKGFSELLDSPAVKQRIAEVLKDRATQFLTSALSLVNSTPGLAECEPQTLFNACLTSASLGLPVNNNLGFSYIIPYGEKIPGTNPPQYKKVAQFQIGYKGFRQLAINSNQYKALEVKAVFEGQYVEDDSFIGYHFDWKSKQSNKVIGYASYFQLLNGFESIYYLTADEVEKHAKKYSQTYKKGFGNWKEEFEKMAKKTVVKLHLNSGFAPLSIEMQKAQISDQSVIEEEGKYTYIDNEDTQTLEGNNLEEENNRIIGFIDKCKSDKELDELLIGVDTETVERLELHIENKRTSFKQTA